MSKIISVKNMGPLPGQNPTKLKDLISGLTRIAASVGEDTLVWVAVPKLEETASGHVAFVHFGEVNIAVLQNTKSDTVEAVLAPEFLTKVSVRNSVLAGQDVKFMSPEGDAVLTKDGEDDIKANAVN